MVVVAHKNRLARFGFDQYKWNSEQNWCKLVVLSETNLSPEQEIVEDVLTVLHFFSSRLYFWRKYKTQISEAQDLPSQELNKVWRQWLAACRYCFNQAIAMQRKKRLSKLLLRNEVM